MAVNTLYALMERTKACFGVQICVHDVSGVTYSCTSLNLPYLWMQHGCEYCSVAKRCLSEKRCMRQKQLVMWMLRRSGSKPFFGVCHMGVCEYILPVVQGGRPIAVVFASGLTKEDREESRAKLETALVKTPTAMRGELREGYERFARESMVTRDMLQYFAELAGERILRASIGMAGRGESDPFAVESVRREEGRSGTVRAILGYIEASMPGTVSLGDLSAAFFMSEGHLCRLFRQEMGTSIIAYVKRMRMQMAARLLLESAEPVSAIAARVGIADPNYFCRAFKSVMGETPSEYRLSRLDTSMHRQNEQRC